MSIDPAEPLSRIPLAIVDVETTGLSPRLGDRVIEIAVLRVVEGEVVESFSQLINPARPISGGITRLTGISDAMVADAPMFAGAIEGFCRTIRGAIVVGHNASFDASFLRSEFRHCGKSLHDEVCDPLVLDTLRLARRLSRGQRNGLSALCARLGVCCDEPAHRALGDCQRTLGVFRSLLGQIGGWGVSWRSLIDIHGRPGTLRERSATRASFAPGFPQLRATG